MNRDYPSETGGRGPRIGTHRGDRLARHPPFPELNESWWNNKYRKYCSSFLGGVLVSVGWVWFTRTWLKFPSGIVIIPCCGFMCTEFVTEVPCMIEIFSVLREVCLIRDKVRGMDRLLLLTAVSNLLLQNTVSNVQRLVLISVLNHAEEDLARCERRLSSIEDPSWRLLIDEKSQLEVVINQVQTLLSYLQQQLLV